jgi:hypothetical protein
MARGVSTVCVACGRPRSPLTAVPVNVAGQPSKVGGALASVAAWIVLAGGVALSAVIAGVLQFALPPGAYLGWILGGATLFLTLAVAIPLLLGGGALRRAGERRQREAVEHAVRALATRNGGIVTAADVGQAIGLTEAQADAVLTDLAKQGGDVRLEVDDDGQLFYTVGRGGLPPRRVRVGAGPRVAGEPLADAEAEADAIDEATATSPKARGRS